MDVNRRRWLALYVLCLGMLMIVLDVTVVNVALPTIQDDLGFSASSLAWVVNSYLIAFGGLLLLAGRLGDLAGRKNVFLIGLSVFTGASLVCGVAQSQGLLVGARFVQGVGGAVTSAVILGMVVTMFPEPREQARAIGVYAAVAAAGGAVGLLAGGVLTHSINWHWIFIVNVPLGVVTGLFSMRLLDQDSGIGLGEGADIPGAVLVTGALMLGVYTIVEPGAEEGWSSASTLVPGAVSLVLLAAFVAREATARRPLIPLRIFRSRNVTGANVVQVLMIAGLFGMFFLGSLYMQRILGYNALEIGLAFLPATVLAAVLSVRYSERLVMRLGPRRMLVLGLVLLMLSLVLFALAPADGEYVIHILPAVIVDGVGAGLIFPALTTLAMSGATQNDAGLASGLLNTTNQVGAGLGIAVLATVSASRSRSPLTTGAPGPEALLAGYHLAFWIGAALVLASIVVALVVLRPPRTAR